MPGAGTIHRGTISYNDGGFALAAGTGVTSDGNDYYRTSGQLTWDWNGKGYRTLAAFQAASGQDAHSVVADPGFANVPSTGFDPAAADSYDFCNAFDPVFCQPPP